MPKGDHNAAKTHCPRGHAYTEDNCYSVRRGETTHAERRCNACRRIRNRRSEGKRERMDVRNAWARRRRARIRARKLGIPYVEPAPLPPRTTPVPERIRSVACAVYEPRAEDGKRPIKGVSETGGAGDIDLAAAYL